MHLKRGTLCSCLAAVLFALLFCLPTRARAIERLRGDVDGDGMVNLTDVIRIFDWLTYGRGPDLCLGAADVNSDGDVDFSDAISIVDFMFFNNENRPAPLDEGSCDVEEEPPTEIELLDREVTVLSPASAMVSWTTTRAANTRVRIGLTPDLDSGDQLINDSVTRHAVVLRDLKPDTMYYYRVASENEKGLAESELGAFRTLASLTQKINKDRPRLLINAEDLARLRQSTARGGRDESTWRKVLIWCDQQLGQPLDGLLEEDSPSFKVRALALAAILTGNKSYHALAVEAALRIVSDGLREEQRSRTEALAYVYDWLHDELDEVTKLALRTHIMRYVKVLEGESRDDEFVTGMTHGNHKSMFLGALAVYGDVPAATEILEQIVNNYHYGFLATWRRFSGSDGGASKGWWYTTYVLPFELDFMAAWRSATGEDLFKIERNWCEGVLDWFLYGLRGDDTFLRDGDTRIYYGINRQNRQHALLVAKEYGNPRAQWLAERAEEVSPGWGPHLIVDMLWRDPDLRPQRPSGRTSKHFRNVGTVVMRESWESDAAIASFRSAEAYTQGHTHRDNCSFTLYYKGGLAIDSGMYDDFGSDHHRNYYLRSVAHNTITVYDAEEEFVLHGKTYANDGGQKWLQPGRDNVPHWWPARAEDTVERSDGYRLGGIPRYEDTEQYTYTMGDGGPSYSRKKLKKFLRHFLWLKDGNGWDHPVVVVFDDVVAASASYRKAYLLHTENTPLIDGKQITAKSGGGKLFHFTLAPEDAVMTPIGGRGMEYVVDGVNYPTVRGVQDKEEPGSWRVEISPGQERATDRFLHVLYPGNVDAAPPASPRGFTAQGLHGCEVGNWVVLFDTGSTIDGIKYAGAQGGTSHLIFGGLPKAVYEVYVNDTYQESVTATSQGTVRFTLDTPGQVRVARAAQ